MKFKYNILFLVTLVALIVCEYFLLAEWRYIPSAGIIVGILASLLLLVLLFIFYKKMHKG